MTTLLLKIGKWQVIRAFEDIFSLQLESLAFEHLANSLVLVASVSVPVPSNPDFDSETGIDQRPDGANSIQLRRVDRSSTRNKQI
jgi:hypothetical protein